MTLWLLIAVLAPLPAMADVPGRGGGCNTVCSLDNRPELTLSDDELASLLAAWATEEMDAPSLPLETLLFHGDSTLALLDGHEIPPERRSYLERELSRDRAVVEMRLVDVAGVVRGDLSPRPVPLIQKQHLAFAQTGSLGTFVTAGRVKRVGLNHLWSRW